MSGCPRCDWRRLNNARQWPEFRRKSAFDSAAVSSQADYWRELALRWTPTRRFAVRSR